MGAQHNIQKVKDGIVNKYIIKTREILIESPFLFHSKWDNNYIIALFYYKAIQCKN